MKDQPWDLNQTRPVGRNWCRFTNTPQKFWGTFPKIWGAKTLFRDFRTRHRISPELNVAWTNKNASVNLQFVPYKLTYFPWPLTQKRLRSVCLLWRNILRPLRCNHQSCDISSCLCNSHDFISHFSIIDSIRASMIVWRLGGKITRTVLCCVVYDSCAQWFAHTWIVLNLHVGLDLDFVCVCVCLGLFFCVSLDRFIPVLLAFVVLGLVSSVPSHDIGLEERFRNDLFCVEWDVKP